jgi:hypothetical protein
VSSWRALRSDPLPWLLSGDAFNLHSRVLLELFGRPADSPAVVRARGAASVCEPVATLLQELHPDGTWSTATTDWQVFSGPAWRLIAALQWGADPTGPRVQAAIDRLLDSTSRELARRSPVSLARLLQTAARAGLWRDPRVVELAAWLEQRTVWASAESGNSLVMAAAVLHALADSGEPRQRRLRDVATEVVLAGVSAPRQGLLRLGHPNLQRTDVAEVLAALARVDAAYDPRMTTSLRRLQLAADADGRWHRRSTVPATLGPLPPASTGLGPSRWISLRATIAVLRYAEEAGLERLFPERPRAAESAASA